MRQNIDSLVFWRKCFIVITRGFLLKLLLIKKIIVNIIRKGEYVRTKIINM